MDFKPQSSFIPKKPIVESGFKRSSGMGLFSFFATIIFILSALASAGIFGYNFYLKKEIVTMSTELQQARKNFQPALIEELARVDSRIKNANDILNKHISVSSVFETLESLTVETIRFNTFQFGSQKSGSLAVTLDGTGKDFNSVAFQSDVFRKKEGFKNAIFSDMELDDFGNVKFQVAMDVLPDLLLYKNSLKTQTEEETKSEAFSSATSSPQTASSTPSTASSTINR